MSRFISEVFYRVGLFTEIRYPKFAFRMFDIASWINPIDSI